MENASISAYLFYPLRPVVAIPSVNCFWAKKYTIKMGMSVITAPAINKCVSGPASVTKFHNPTIKGRQFSRVVTNNGHMKAFHALVNENKSTVIIGALLMGKTT